MTAQLWCNVGMGTVVASCLDYLVSYLDQLCQDPLSIMHGFWRWCGAWQGGSLRWAETKATMGTEAICELMCGALPLAAGLGWCVGRGVHQKGHPYLVGSCCMGSSSTCDLCNVAMLLQNCGH